MPCALCLSEAPLQKSHIIPEFLYETLYDDFHRIQILSVVPNQGNKLEQKGIREKLLCSACEQKFSAWERYASLVLKGGATFTSKRDHDLLFISGLDYAKFKLFQLSILWRAGVSKLPLFNQVKLGPHAEVIRQLLLNENPDTDDRYGCFMFGLELNNKAFTQVIVQPRKVRIDGQNFYQFVFGGFAWVICVSNRSIESPLNSCTLKSTGDAVILIRKATDMTGLSNFAKELQNMGRVPLKSI